MIAIAFYSLGSTVAVVTDHGYVEFADYRMAAEFSTELRAACMTIEFIRALITKRAK